MLDFARLFRPTNRQLFEVGLDERETLRSNFPLTCIAPGNVGTTTVVAQISSPTEFTTENFVDGDSDNDHRTKSGEECHAQAETGFMVASFDVGRGVKLMSDVAERCSPCLAKFRLWRIRASSFPLQQLSHPDRCWNFRWMYGPKLRGLVLGTYEICFIRENGHVSLIYLTACIAE